MKAFMERFTSESLLFKGAPELMRNSGFMHGITYQGLIKRLNDNVPKMMDYKMSVTKASILRAKAAEDFKRRPRDRRHDRFTPLAKTPKEILAMNRERERHNTDDCLNLRGKTKEVVKSGQLAHLVKEIKKGNNKESTSKAAKKPDPASKDKGVAIFMTWDTCSGSSPVYYAGDDEISNKGRSSHNRERKSQYVRNSNGGSTSHPTPKSGKCQGCNTPGVSEQSVMIGGALTNKRKIAMCDVLKANLDNVDATYKRLVDKAFDRQIRRNLEVYMDDQVIKSHGEQEAIRDIEETFRTLRRINMKLNPKKCTFGVEERMFLRSRKVGMIWSFGFLGVCKITKILFVCEYGLTIEWNYEDLTELLKGKCDEFVLNHEEDKNDSGVISLKSDLTIKSPE
ncbi:reverse transcriptase domain-containing protein [Tanacetum coccineum]|uniref:Reverse transcriptase domain-containing protein n=1 Tax=Tanacetum coccineum TaxID=301880 RepID=A0ABQ4WRA9_9ASTR